MMEEEFELDDSGKSFIEVDDELRLLMTHRNWQLQKKLIAKENAKVVGKVTWQSFRYYTSLNGALKDLVHIKLSREKFSSLHELIEANNRVFEEMKQVFLPDYTIEKAK